MPALARMKGTLEKHLAAAPDPQYVTQDVVMVYHTKFKVGEGEGEGEEEVDVQEQWFHTCEEEHRNINAFYQEKRLEAVRRFVTLKVW